MLKGKDMLSIHDLSVDEVNEILALGHELKAKQKAGIEHHILKGKTLGLPLKPVCISWAVRHWFCPTVICSWAGASLSRILPVLCPVIWTAS